MKESGSYFFNYFEFLLLSEIEAAVCQSQLIILDSPFIYQVHLEFLRLYLLCYYHDPPKNIFCAENG